MSPTLEPASAIVRLVRRESIGNQYYVLTFDVTCGVPARAGQFAMLRRERRDEALSSRPMSYLSGGNTPSVLVKVLGDASADIGSAEVGETFVLLGPLGKTWRRPKHESRPLLVAGGAGVAPLLFFARELHAAGVCPIALYGGRTAADLPLEHELREVADVYVTTDDGSRGRKGRVTDLLPDAASADSEIYTCGPDRMMAAVAKQCRALRLRCEVSLATPMACGYGACMGCSVRTTDGGSLYACTEGPCVDAGRIAWDEGSCARPCDANKNA